MVITSVCCSHLPDHSGSTELLETNESTWNLQWVSPPDQFPNAVRGFCPKSGWRTVEKQSKPFDKEYMLHYVCSSTCCGKGLLWCCHGLSSFILKWLPMLGGPVLPQGPARAEVEEECRCCAPESTILFVETITPNEWYSTSLKLFGLVSVCIYLKT